MRTTSLGAFVAFALCLSHAAQADPGLARFRDAASRPSALRIESSMSLQIPLTSGVGAEDQLKQGEDARKALYQASTRECAMLLDIFKMECRIQSVRVVSNVQQRGSGTETVTVTGSSTYELSTPPN